MNYGAVIKKLRDDKQKTQQDIADVLGIARQTYNHYELQENIIPLKHLNNLANYYDVSIDYLFGLNDLKQYPNHSNEIDIMKSQIRLKEFRKDYKLTQVKLANILNTFHTVIVDYEHGKNLIATPFLYTICKKYNISADYLLGKIDIIPILNKK